MSNQSSGLKKKPVTRDKSQVRKDAAKTRGSSRDKLEVEMKKNGERGLVKRTSSKTLVKQTSGERNATRSTSSRPMLAGKSHQELTSTSSSSKNVLKKQSSDPEKRGVSSIYLPKRSSTKASTEPPKIAKKSEPRTKETPINTRQRLPSKERRKSRTLSPSEVKVLNKKYLNSPTKPQRRDSSPEYDYEDDFEDYESDFQDCTETDASEVSDESQQSEEPELEPMELKSKEPIKFTNKSPNKPLKETTREHEDHMLDSGHYELEEARRRAARIDLMSSRTRIPIETIQRPIVFTEEKPSEIKSLPSSTDEGFEDGRSGDFAKSSPLSGPHEFINLRDISMKLQEKPKKLSRGRKLLQMIKLDTVEWSIYESTPINYEEFIIIHGKINTRQIATQTNEDDLSVETQTEEIKLRDMWTQFPVVCRSDLKSNDDIKEFERELIGVGCDEDHVQLKRPVYDILTFNEFLGTAGRVMLALLERQLGKTSPGSDEGGEMPFSETTIRLAVSKVTFLSGRPVVMIRYSDASSRVLLSIHAPADEDMQDIETSGTNDFYMTDCCIGCQWNIYEPSRPTKLFYSGSNITAVCMHPVNYNIVFAGLEDGSISLWDLEEDESYHPKFIDKDNEVEWVLRSPTFSTIGSFQDDDDKFMKIVALKVLSKIETDVNEKSGKFMPIQICSLDEEGNCTIWSVLRNLDTGGSLITQQLGQSWWGKIRLVKSHQICLSQDKNNDNLMDANNCMTAFRDLSVDTIDTNNLYIAGNTSKVLHVTRTGKRLKPSVYDGNFMDHSGTTCIEFCPFGQPYFLVGFTDGTLRLYSSMIEKPLVQLKNLNSTAPIKVIQWSRSKPFTIYVLDDKSKIHIWDLNRSDIFPLYTISPRKHGHIDSMQLSPCKTDYDMINQYLALGLDNGAVEIHKFTREFHYSNNADQTAELNTFLHYVAVN